MSAEKQTPEQLADSLRAVLDAYHQGHLVPVDEGSEGYVMGVIDAGEAALASAQAVDDLNSARERVAVTGKPSLSELTERFGSAQAQQEPVARPFWSYRRYGSEPEKGYTIIAKRNEHATNGEPVAYLGDGPLLGDACHAICEAHNAAPPVQQGPKTCHDLTPEQHEELTKQFDAADALEEMGWVFDGDEWLRPSVQQATRPDPCPDIKGYVSGGGLDHVMGKAWAWGGDPSVQDYASTQPERAGVVLDGFALVPVAAYEQCKAALAHYSQAPENYHGSVLRMRDALRKLVAAPPAPSAVVKESLTTPEKREPLTAAQVRRLWNNSPEIHKDAPSFAAFARIVKLVQAAHSIPPADAKEGE